MYCLNTCSNITSRQVGSRRFRDPDLVWIYGHRTDTYCGICDVIGRVSSGSGYAIKYCFFIF